MRETISAGLHAIESLSPVEAAILACLVDGVADYHSRDPHAVIAAGVRDIARLDHATVAEVERVRAAFAELGFEVSGPPSVSAEGIAPAVPASPAVPAAADTSTLGALRRARELLARPESWLHGWTLGDALHDVPALADALTAALDALAEVTAERDAAIARAKQAEAVAAAERRVRAAGTQYRNTQEARDRFVFSGGRNDLEDRRARFAEAADEFVEACRALRALGVDP